MIRLKRPTVPDFFNSQEYKSEVESITAFYMREPFEREQEKFKPKYKLNNQLKNLLTNAFHNKCAFCESVFSERSSVFVERFRPSINAMNLNGKISEEHYWWLRYEWSNLYPICKECNQKKSNLFPVKKKRALPNTKGEELQKELPLLLDPCMDNPEEHFCFDFKSGLMISNTERGRVTIDIYGLNRQQLLMQRKNEMIKVHNQLSVILNMLKSKKDLDISTKLGERDLLDLFDQNNQSFLLIKRQYVLSVLSDNLHLLNYLFFKDKWIKVLNCYPNILGKTQRDAEIEKYKDYILKMDTYDLNKKSKLDFYFRKSSMYIEKVEIKNFKTIRHLNIEILPNKEGNAPWFLVLGENSTGKSSILKAIALTLMGNNNRKKIYGLDARKFLKDRTNSGYVKVYLTGRLQPIELFFDSKNPEFRGNIEDPPILLMGYGSTRLLSKNLEINNIEREINAIRCENLFNPIFSLVDAELWLSQLSNRKFRDATDTIKRLFAIDKKYRFYRRNNKSKGRREIYIKLFGAKTTLEDLSDGYQSVLALACDIMMVLQNIWQDSEYAQGVVLLDELDVHLHPRWKMQIVNKLKQTFPKIQFISTSHEPLVLRGLSKEEILVLKRDKFERLYTVDNLPSPEALRIDQILTSPYFGLNSTIEPEIEKLFDKYYYLLSEKVLLPEEQKELNDMEIELKGMKLLGDTPRDQLMYRAIDEYLAREKENIKRGEVQKLKEETIKRVVDIMASLDIEDNEV